MKTFFLFFNLLLSVPLIAQTSHQLEIVKKFEMAKNDSVFISKYSQLKAYHYSILNKEFSHDDFSEVDSILFNSPLNKVVGPFYTDSFYVWFKIIGVDSTVKMRAGNIWVSARKYSESQATLRADSILNLTPFENYDFLCQTYSDDQNKKRDCDLGWFVLKQMVKPFEEEVLKHQKGEIFKVKTEYGWHIVKILEDQVNIREIVYTCPLYLKRE